MCVLILLELHDVQQLGKDKHAMSSMSINIATTVRHIQELGKSKPALSKLHRMHHLSIRNSNDVHIAGHTHYGYQLSKNIKVAMHQVKA